MQPAPTENEKKTSPMESSSVFQLNLEKSGRKRYSTPFMAPGCIRPVMIRMIMKINSIGMRILEHNSMPPRMPKATTNPTKARKPTCAEMATQGDEDRLPKSAPSVSGSAEGNPMMASKKYRRHQPPTTE